MRALVLWRVTGGGFAVKRLAERYYDQYVRLAGEGGMAAVCAEEHFAELIRKRPSNRERLMAIDPKEFISDHAGLARAVRGGRRAAADRHHRSRLALDQGADLHHPGQRPHPRQRDRRGAPRGSCRIARSHSLGLVDQNVDIVPAEEWYKMADDIAAIFCDFLARKLPQGISRKRQRA